VGRRLGCRGSIRTHALVVLGEGALGNAQSAAFRLS
jgi:hypothetical protein